jgi:hypothetical protein
MKFSKGDLVHVSALVKDKIEIYGAPPKITEPVKVVGHFFKYEIGLVIDSTGSDCRNVQILSPIYSGWVYGAFIDKLY